MTLTLAKTPGPAAEAPSDESLVRLLLAGDASAGDELVSRHNGALMRYLHRLSGNENSAEELHQQTWLSVLDHLEKFDPKSTAGGFKSWLFRIATNKANDVWRSRAREKVAKEGLRLITEDSHPDAGHRLEGSEQAQKLKRAIDQLPDAQRQVLLLRYYSDMKFVDIADVLGCPLNTALGRMHKAIQKLKILMEA